MIAVLIWRRVAIFVALTWLPVAGAVRDRITRKRPDSTGFDPFGFVTAAFFNDTAVAEGGRTPAWSPPWMRVCASRRAR